MKWLFAALFALFSLFVVKSFGQSQHIGPSYGINAGLGVFNISNNDNGSPVNGFSFGIYGSFPVSERIYIEPELNYQQQGAKTGIFPLIHDNRTNYERNVKIDYVNVPVFIKCLVPTTNLSFGIAPQIGFKTSATIASAKLSSVNGTYFSGLFGAEYFIPINDFNSFVLSARYSYGFSKVFNYDDWNYKNRGFTFMVGFRL